MSTLSSDITIYRNNDWAPRAVITKPNADQDDEEPYTAADVAVHGLQLFLSSVEDTDTALGDVESPSHFEVTASPLHGTATDGEYLLALSAENVTTANLEIFPTGVAYLHIRVAGGARSVIPVPVKMIKYGVAA